jgi:tetratricopeptide (TPR) repeat protein
MSLDDHGEIRYLDGAELSDRLGSLASRGIPLSQRPRWSLDPNLYGPEPTASAKAWMERRQCADAEAASDEAVRARPEDGRVRLERARFFAARARPERAAADFAAALSLDVLGDLSYETNNDVTVPRDEKNAAFARVLAKVSGDIFEVRAIADRVSELVPSSTFSELNPLLRARYWVDRGRWADAEAAYKEAIDAEGAGWSPWAEFGRYYARRSMPDHAGHYLVQAMVVGAPAKEVARDILASPSIRNKAFSLMTPKGVEKLLDAVFPEDPFVR